MGSIAEVTFEEEMVKNPEMKQEFENFKDWYSKQRHLPQVHDKELALFLNSCYYSCEKAKITIDNYFTVRTHCPELFSQMDPTKVDIKNGKQVLQVFMLPGTTPDGSRVIFMKFGQTSPSDFNFSEACKSFLMAADLEHRYYGTSKGFKILFDMDGIVFGHVAKLNVLIIKKTLYYLQEAMPVRLTGLHFMNTVPFMDTILALMKPFMKKELMDNLHLHTSNSDTLYQYVPQKMLPKDYTGGESPSIQDLHDNYVKLRKENKNWFEAQEKRNKVEEKLRPGKKKDAGEIFGVIGSFKKLALD